MQQVSDTRCCSGYLTRSEHFRVTLTYHCLIAVFTSPDPSTNNCFSLSLHYFGFFWCLSVSFELSFISKAPSSGQQHSLHTHDSYCLKQQLDVAFLPFPFVHCGPLQAEDLCNLTPPTRSLLQAGRVFAVHLVEGQLRHGKISLDAKTGRLYLHSLKEHNLPLGSTTLQVS